MDKNVKRKSARIGWIMLIAGMASYTFGRAIEAEALRRCGFDCVYVRGFGAVVWDGLAIALGVLGILIIFLRR